MRTRLPLLALAAVLCGPATVRAAAEPADPLAPLAWLIGAWTSPTQAPDGSAATNVVTYEWTSGGKAIRYWIDRTAPDGTVRVLEGLCGWHPVEKRIVAWEMNAAGDFTDGVIRFEAGVQRHDEVIYGADGSTLPVRAVVLREGEERFVFKASVEKGGQGGEWTVVFEAAYTRKPGD